MTTIVKPQTAKDSDGSPHRAYLFGIQIDAVHMQQAVAQICDWVRQRPNSCRFVVTPNVDHIVMLQGNDDFRQAYAKADLVLADGWPVVWASRTVGQPLPELVPGSDLVPALFGAASASFRSPCESVSTTDRQPLRVFLLGAAPGVAARAARRIESDWPGVKVVCQYSPPLGFEHDSAETASILDRIADARPDVLVVGLGAPKQELWVHRHQERLHASVALCVGATIDFLAGQRRRAPLWMRRTGIEWLHRMLSEPRRLTRRYARGACVFPRLVWKEWRARNRHELADAKRIC
ncbi:MAG: WecB/TagA/CpsF family glycosyltransferase [Pirellulaceae bacterium]|jgi:N-acetylglucosaminyldiphosphoundecaprenol N-acetyl-beta-D-mannosaminyltransferase|nr:WecB/TagA/CpsF family glycosyltransferase [Pirellulaceae bacterium]MDP6555229.1 WecB/TagA/CpsF family glycosyltransferase [Pirellulaceae bacterium]